MKKIILFGTFCFCYAVGTAQQGPTGSPVPGNYTTPQQAASAWYRGGNNQANTAWSNNIFGTNWNSPIYTVTGGVNNYRMKVNGIFDPGSQYSINNYTPFNSTLNTTGYVLIGRNNNSLGPSNSGQSMHRDMGAFSLLHLNGPGNGGNDEFQEYGYRPWMKTGITFTGNRDLSYMGLRQLGEGEQSDITETVIQWSDNDLFEGPDNMVFRFSGYGGGDQNVVSSNRISSTDMDARHIAQFTPFGLFGLGNTFGTNAPNMMAANYNTPQSLFHMSYDFRTGQKHERYGFSQITYRNPDGAASMIGRGESENDGLRIGIDNDILTNGGPQHLNAYLRWQENSPFVLQTDWNNSPGGIAQGERMRVSSTSAPGVPASQAGNGNFTRVSVNYTGSSPITRPQALLHLGQNSVNNWAPWMDYGSLVSQTAQGNTANMFTGVTGSGYVEANVATVGYGGSDLLFMNDALGEVGGFDETTGYLNVGDYGPNGTINAAPTEQIDVDGNGRFRDIPSQGGQSLILGLQSGANANDVELSRLDFSGNQTDVLLGNGTWGPATGGGSGYFDCSDPNALMPSDSRFDLNGNSFYFEGNGSQSDQVGIGHNCGVPLAGKLDVLQTGFNTNPAFFGQKYGGLFPCRSRSYRHSTHGLWCHGTRFRKWSSSSKFAESALLRINRSYNFI